MYVKIFNSLKTWELKTFYASCHKDTKLILNKRILLRLFLLKNVNEKLFTKVSRETSEGYTPYTPPSTRTPRPTPFQSLPESRQFAEFPEKIFCNLMKSVSLKKIPEKIFYFNKISSSKKILEKIFVKFKNRPS